MQRCCVPGANAVTKPSSKWTDDGQALLLERVTSKSIEGSLQGVMEKPSGSLTLEQLCLVSFVAPLPNQ